MKSQITNATHRENARNALSTHWGMMAWITFLAFFIQSIISSIVGGIAQFQEGSTGSNIMSFLLNNFIYFALTYGTYYCALRILRRKSVKASMVTAIFQGKYYGPMLLINLIQYFVGFLLNLVVLLPVFLSYGAMMYFGLMFNTVSVKQYLAQTTGDVLLLVILVVCAVLMIFVSMFIGGIFQFSIWAKIDDPTLSVGEALKYGFYLMKDRFGQYLLLQFSFIGWFILGTLVFGIGLFWVAPYHNVAIASFYATAREEKGAPAIVD